MKQEFLPTGKPDRPVGEDGLSKPVTMRVFDDLAFFAKAEGLV
jgi:hypothetical protein